MSNSRHEVVGRLANFSSHFKTSSESVLVHEHDPKEKLGDRGAKVMFIGSYSSLYISPEEWAKWRGEFDKAWRIVTLNSTSTRDAHKGGLTIQVQNWRNEINKANSRGSKNVDQSWSILQRLFDSFRRIPYISNQRIGGTESNKHILTYIISGGIAGVRNQVTIDLQTGIIRAIDKDKQMKPENSLGLNKTGLLQFLRDEWPRLQSYTALGADMFRTCVHYGGVSKCITSNGREPEMWKRFLDLLSPPRIQTQLIKSPMLPRRKINS